MRHTNDPAKLLESDEVIRVQVDLHRDVAWIAHASFPLYSYFWLSMLFPVELFSSRIALKCRKPLHGDP